MHVIRVTYIFTKTKSRKHLLREPSAAVLFMGLDGEKRLCKKRIYYLNLEFILSSVTCAIGFGLKQSCSVLLVSHTSLSSKIPPPKLVEIKSHTSKLLRPLVNGSTHINNDFKIDSSPCD